jgi:2-iminoacetate synthase
MAVRERADFIKEDEIAQALARAEKPSKQRVGELLDKARELNGLSMEDVAVLFSVDEPDVVAQVLQTARDIKQLIYGNRLVLFAPLYVSNLCSNECSYCAFRVTNKSVIRRTLTQEEIAAEVRILIGQGHKRLILVAGETLPREGFKYVLDSIDTIYKTKVGPGEIRRVNVNLAPQGVDEFRLLKDAGIGTYQCFQETYHRATYSAVHLLGKKAEYDWRATVFDRAMTAGIDDVGLGVLYGLYDWRWETLALMQHIAHLEREFGCGPHTLSFPRIEPAVGSDLASRPPHAVSDADFLKLIAIMRLAVPYTGMIMSSRENPEIRRQTFELGISQISAGCRTDPGGYAEGPGDSNGSQFQSGDHRGLDEIVRDVIASGHMPSFCTACYRSGRTGADFMDLAKPGEIKYHCQPNAVSTLEEYLIDYASPETKAAGDKFIQIELANMDEGQLAVTNPMLKEVRAGKRDVFV